MRIHWQRVASWLQQPRKRLTRRRRPGRLALEELEPRIMLADDVFVVPGKPNDQVAMRFEQSARAARDSGDAGFFFVEDAAGRIGTLAPGDLGYPAAALENARIVFNAEGYAEQQVALHGGQQLGFFWIDNDTVAHVLAANPRNAAGAPVAFFSFDAANAGGLDHLHAQLGPDNRFVISWENSPGPDADFNDVVIHIASPDPGIVAVPGRPGETIPVRITLKEREAAYRNEIGLFAVDDVFGRIGKLLPGDAGYAAAALGRRRGLLGGAAKVGNAKAVNLPGGGLFAFYLVQNNSAYRLLQRNRLNQLDRAPVVFFSIAQANPDGVEHVRRLSDTEFAFEDMTWGGDADFDDIVIDVTFGTARGRAALPPAVSARLARDTAPDDGTNLDRITFDVAIVGAVAASDRIVKFRAGLDDQPAADFVNVFPALRRDGSFALDRNRLNQIAGGVLADGNHILHVVAVDRRGRTTLWNFAFTLDTHVSISFDLGPESDSAPAGDQATTLAQATLLGQTEADATVVLETTGASVGADASGMCRFDAIDLELGDNNFAMRATDLAGNVATASRVITRQDPPPDDSCTFDTLEGWTFAQSGGIDPGVGAVALEDGAAVLREGNSLLVTLARTFTAPAEPAQLHFRFSGPDFDTSAVDSIKDAFEVALLDENGAPLVFPFIVDRDAFFNISEGQPAALGAGTQIDGATVTTALAGLTPGSTFRVVFRLVNNDGDTQTAVRIHCVEIVAGGVGQAFQTAGRLESLPHSIDFATLADVSANVRVEYLRTTLNEADHVIQAELAVQNRGQNDIAGPLLAVVTNLSDAAVRVRDFDGFTPDGFPFYDLTDTLDDSRLPPDAASAAKGLSFFVPDGAQFDYELVFLAQLNRAPRFITVPDTAGLAGRSYIYRAQAEDADGDALSYSLLEAPAGLVLDSAGVLSWSAEIDNIGRHAVRIEAADGRGGSAEQAFLLEIRDNVPNRPPVFTSDPVVDAAVNAAYAYQPSAVDEDGDPLSYSLTVGPAGMTIDADTGLLDWTPIAAQLGVHAVSITVADGRAGMAMQSFEIDVQPQAGNHAPVIISEPGTLFAVELPGTPTGEVSPTLISLATSETRALEVSVVVPPAPDLGRIDLTPTSLDINGMTADTGSLTVGGVIRVAVDNRGADDYTSASVGTFDVLAFEDRNSNFTYEAGVDAVLGTASFAGSIASGEIVQVEVPIAGILQFLDRPIHVFVDGSEVIPETDESNNLINSGVSSTYEPTNDWIPVVEWQYSLGTLSRYQPAVAPLTDTNGDGQVNERDIPAILFVAHTTTLQLVALRGDNGQEIFRATIPTTLGGTPIPVVGDLEGDGRPDIIVEGGQSLGSVLHAFNNDGTLKWTSAKVTFPSMPYLADLDGDGRSEILFGTAVINFDGTTRFLRTPPNPNGFLGFYEGEYGGAGASGGRQAADLDLDGIPEIIAGPSALDINGNSLWEWQVTAPPAWNLYFSQNGGPFAFQFRSDLRLHDGPTAIANLDDDPYPEIVLVNDDGRQNVIWVFNHDGSLHSGPFEILPREPATTPGGGINVGGNVSLGEATIADFDGDGRPEIAVPGAHSNSADFTDDFQGFSLGVYKLEGTTLTTVWQREMTLIYSVGNPPAISSFDFDADGASEMIFRDYRRLYILDGRDGSTIFEIGLSAGLQTSWIQGPPLVADVDNDGEAEIVTLVSPDYAVVRGGSLQPAGLVVIGEVNGNWIHARRVWNQWGYNVTNINEDGSVPAVARNSWEVDNSERAQVSIEGLDPFAAADLTASLITIDAANCPVSVEVSARIGNGGSLQVGPGVPVEIYLGNPSTGGALIGRTSTSRVLFPGEFEDVSITWTNPAPGEIIALVNARQNPAPTPSRNLSLLPYTWANASGIWQFLEHNIDALYGIDGSASIWPRSVLLQYPNVDPRPDFYEVHFPFPVNASSVTIQNQGVVDRGFYGIGALEFSNGFTVTLDLGTIGAGTVAFPEQQGVTWVRLTSSVQAPNRASLSEFIVGGSYAEPPTRFNEGGGDGNNTASFLLTALPCAGDGSVPSLDAGRDVTIFVGDSVMLAATFSDPGILGTHTAFIDWNDGTAEPGIVTEMNGAGTVAGMHVYSAEGTYTVTVTLRDAAGNEDSDTFVVAVLDPSLRGERINVRSSDATVAFTNLTGPLSGVGVARFDVRITAPEAPARFDLLFEEETSGRLLGSIPVTVNSVYQYQLRAIDGDGDPITYRLLQGPAGTSLDPISGLLSWPASLTGVYSFRVEASDGRGGVALQDYALTVAAGQPNSDPVITSTPPDRAVVFRDLSCTVTATDADGETLRYFLTQAPTGMAIDNVTGAISWRPIQAQLGSHDIVVTVRDPRGGEASQNVTLEVTADLANQPPVFTSTPPEVADPGVLLRHNVTASDGENDPIRFDLPLRPAGMAIDALAGTLVWRPGETQVGVHDVIVRARDGHGGVTLQAFQITVRPPNTAPVITSTPPAQAVQDVTYAYQVLAQDTAGDVLSYRLDVAPANMTIDADTGAVRWTATPAQLGPNDVVVAVADNRGGETLQAFEVTVVAVADNDAPVITGAPRTDIDLAGTYFYLVQASDPNADPLTYTLTTSPTGMTIDARGLLIWQPTSGQFGANAVTVAVDDGRGGMAMQSFTIDVVSTPRNQSPVISSTPPPNAVAGRLYAYDVAAEDSDGDPLTYELIVAPAGMSIHPERGAIRWQPTLAQLGTQDVVVQVFDPHGGSTTRSIRINVRATNTPPVILSTPPTEAAALVLATYPVRAQDRDGNPLTYSLIAAPDGMTIDAATGLISWTPDAGQVGEHQVEVGVEDGVGGQATQTFTMVIAALPRNLPPLITSRPVLVATELLPYDYVVTADDPEGAALEFVLLQGPNGMAIDAAGRVTWTPQPGQLGSHTVAVAARDPAGASVQQRFALVVAEDNQAPVISSTPVLTATAGRFYTYQIIADDPDGDFLRYMLEVAPAGMTLDQGVQTSNQADALRGFGLGRLTWTPGFADAGDHTVRIRVTDPRGLSAVQDFTVSVAGDTEAPRVRLSISSNPVALNSTAIIVISAADNVGVAELQLTVDGVPVALDAAGRATVTLAALGLRNVVATAFDAAGNSAQASRILQVFDPTVAGAPAITPLGAPLADAVITAPTDIIGTVDDPNLAFYTLEVAPLGSTAFREVARGTSPVVNGVLGRFDPSLLTNDSYVLRLMVTNTGGVSSATQTIVHVAGELKLGNFTLSFSDMSVPVSGIPITMVRTYDTLNAAIAGDLGHGWRLEFRDARLRTSVAKTGLERDGIFNGYREGDRVYVTLPGGKREGFTFRPQVTFFLGQRFFAPYFEPDPGVTSRLEINSLSASPLSRALLSEVRLRERDGEYIDVFRGVPFNPADEANFGGAYRLTTREGIEYQIDAMNGQMLNVRDHHGNIVHFTDGGIISSAGPQIAFERDVRGRIVAVIDPMDNAVRYQYDAAGDLIAVTDRMGNTTQFVYLGNPPHYLERVIDALGRTGARTEYDADGRMVRIFDAAGNPVELVHDLNNSRETVLDALGNPTTYEYDARGNIVTEIDALGGVTRRTYDANGNMLTETDALGRTSAFTYDAVGNVLTERDALGNTRQFTYDARGLPLTVTDPLGNTSNLIFDASGNLSTYALPTGGEVRAAFDSAGNDISITHANGGIYLSTFDARGNRTSSVDPIGKETLWTSDANGNRLTETVLRTINGVRTPLTTTFAYDADNRLIRVTDPLGGVSQIEYNELGQTTARTDALGRRTAYEYDTNGRLVRTTYPDGLFGAQEYDAAGNKIRQTNRAGRTTVFEYDALNRPVATISPDATPAALTDNPRIGTEYDAAGQVIAEIDENGNRTEFVYDLAGRLIRTIQPEVFDQARGVLVRPETVEDYDAAGNVVSVLDPNGNRTQIFYDADNRPTITLFADGSFTEVGYDLMGAVVSSTDQTGKTTFYENDPVGNLLSVTLPALTPNQAPLVTRYTYDEAGNLLTQSDALERVTRFQYDARNRRVRRTLPLGQSETFVYDAVGNVIAHTDFNGQTTLFEYDSDNRLVIKRYPDSTTVEFAYTAAGQRQTAIDSRGTTTYAYDERDRLVSRTDPDGRTIAYTYDAAGNRTSLTAPSGTTSYSFDALKRLETVVDPALGETRYFYDSAGNLLRTELPNNTSENRTYDALHRLQYIETLGPSGIIASFRYTLDAAGNRVAAEENTGRQVAYAYDEVYRLISETIDDSLSGSRTIAYTYDGVGNRLTRDDSAEGLTQYSYDDNDRLILEDLAGQVTQYTYDANGNRLSRVSAIDQVFFEWDFENRLVGADTDGEAAADVRYVYDADGIRIAQVNGGVETRFLIDANQPYAQVVEEYTSDGAVQASNVYGHDLISQVKETVRFFYHVDGLGSTRVLTDASAEILARYIYDAFGRIVGQAGSANPYLFAGEQFDALLGFYNLRARYYDLTTGTFISSDPFQGHLREPFSLHRYLYASDNPINRIDPSGKASLTLPGLAVQAGIAAIVGAVVYGLTYTATGSHRLALGAGMAAAVMAFSVTRLYGILESGITLQLTTSAVSSNALKSSLDTIRRVADQTAKNQVKRGIGSTFQQASRKAVQQSRWKKFAFLPPLLDGMRGTTEEERRVRVQVEAQRQLAEDAHSGYLNLLIASMAAGSVVVDESPRLTPYAAEFGIHVLEALPDE